MSVAREFVRHAGVAIRVRGLVQGVGFRPTVWRLAYQCGVAGEVRNDAEGVLIRVWGEPAAIEDFLARLRTEAPPLARIDGVECVALAVPAPDNAFRIIASDTGRAQTGIVPDAAVCPQCIEETLTSANRRYRYAFTNCTHCGPRLSIVRAIPYDRANTSMAEFVMCPECRAEYDEPAERRFHAQPNACVVCGPKVRLERADGQPLEAHLLARQDEVDAACDLLMQGEIVAIKGIGGFHLACDACNAQAVARLRDRKRRFHKPFALMARDLAVIRRYCTVTPEDEAALTSPAAPIVVLAAHEPERVADAVAPGQRSLGFMLPYTPLHHLLLRRMTRPIVLTSGNLSEEPQCTDNSQAREKLSSIADYLLTHDREIVNRVDDSVVRHMDSQIRILRRARGYAPAPLRLPVGFERAPEMLALGGELKNTFCLVKEGQAIVSQHMGDLEDAAAFADYDQNLRLYRDLFAHDPKILGVDQHPEYLSTKLGRNWAERESLRLEEIQHHHAHIASCMAENRVPLNTKPVLGVVLDGLGYGEDGTLWGGEFLLADYAEFERLRTFKSVAMPGGTRAIREPWRNTYAHIVAAIGWGRCQQDYGDLELTRFLETKPLAALNAMMTKGINSPRASSCGRLFDAVAAAIGICRDQVSYEGQAAIELEALIDERMLDAAGEGYPFWIECSFPPHGGCTGFRRNTVSPRQTPEGMQARGLDRLGWGVNSEQYRSPQPLPARGEGTASTVHERNDSRLLTLGFAPMWHALLDDLARDASRPLMAARFHVGLARAIVEVVCALKTRATSARLTSVGRDDGSRIVPHNNVAMFENVALSGGVFQNKTLLERVAGGLRAEGFKVISHRQVPANDGGLSLGQAAIACARALKANKSPRPTGCLIAGDSCIEGQAGV